MLQPLAIERTATWSESTLISGQQPTTRLLSLSGRRFVRCWPGWHFAASSYRAPKVPPAIACSNAARQGRKGVRPAAIHAALDSTE